LVTRVLKESRKGPKNTPRKKAPKKRHLKTTCGENKGLYMGRQKGR